MALHPPVSRCAYSLHSSDNNLLAAPSDHLVSEGGWTFFMPCTSENLRSADCYFLSPLRKYPVLLYSKFKKYIFWFCFHLVCCPYSFITLEIRWLIVPGVWHACGGVCEGRYGWGSVTTCILSGQSLGLMRRQYSCVQGRWCRYYPDLERVNVEGGCGVA